MPPDYDGNELDDFVSTARDRFDFLCTEYGFDEPSEKRRRAEAWLTYSNGPLRFIIFHEMWSLPWGVYEYDKKPHVMTGRVPAHGSPILDEALRRFRDDRTRPSMIHAVTQYAQAVRNEIGDLLEQSRDGSLGRKKKRGQRRS